MKHTVLPEFPDLPCVWDLDAMVEWVVEGMFPARTVNLIASESGTGKTWVAYDIAGAVLWGKSFIGLPVKQMPVLYIDAENPLALVKDRLGKLGIPKTKEFRIWGGWCHDLTPPGPDDARVARFVDDVGGGLIIWDSLVVFHPGDENSGTETRRFMQHFRDLANLGATIIILHHAGKSSQARNYRGSSDIKASVDTAYSLEKIGLVGRDRLEKLRMKNFKSRCFEGRDFSMEFVAGEGFRPLVTIANNAKDSADLQSLLGEVPVNGTEFKRLAKDKKIPRERAEQFLKDWPYKRAGSRPREIVYFAPPKAA